MMSWGVTSKVTTCRLTRTGRSMIGLTITRPGPRAGRTLPSRKIRSRSYSRTTLMDMKARMTATMTMMPIAVAMGRAYDRRRLNGLRRPKDRVSVVAELGDALSDVVEGPMATLLRRRTGEGFG